tara:strand:+ start:834 stop:1391 length:558 start_codon:yes stop_codon:yes gene_type:complete
MFKNNIQGYGWLSIVFHWTSAVIIIGMFSVGWWMVDLDYYSPWYTDAPHYHKSVGLLLIALTLVRLLWKLSQPSPQAQGKKWEKKSAKITHVFLYLLIFSLFVSGYLISTADDRGIDVFNWFSLGSLGRFFADQEDFSGMVHEYVAYVLIALASFHGLAALKHHFIDNDNTLVRMLTTKQQKEQK